MRCPQAREEQSRAGVGGRGEAHPGPSGPAQGWRAPCSGPATRPLHAGHPPRPRPEYICSAAASAASSSAQASSSTITRKPVGEGQVAPDPCQPRHYHLLPQPHSGAQDAPPPLGPPFCPFPPPRRSCRAGVHTLPSCPGQPCTREKAAGTNPEVCPEVGVGGSTLQRP